MRVNEEDRWVMVGQKTSMAFVDHTPKERESFCSIANYMVEMSALSMGVACYLDATRVPLETHFHPVHRL